MERNNKEANVGNTIKVLMTKGKQKLSMFVLLQYILCTLMNMELYWSQWKKLQRSLFHLTLFQLDFDLKNMINN